MIDASIREDLIKGMSVKIDRELKLYSKFKAGSPSFPLIFSLGKFLGGLNKILELSKLNKLINIVKTEHLNV